jgi:hypothetical protein
MPSNPRHQHEFDRSISEAKAEHQQALKIAKTAFDRERVAAEATHFNNPDWLEEARHLHAKAVAAADKALNDAMQKARAKLLAAD